MRGSRFRRAAWCGVILAVAWLLWMTLRPSQALNVPGVHMGNPVRQVNLQPFRFKAQMVKVMMTAGFPAARRSARTYLTVDVLGNIAVFVPLGAGLAAANLPSRGVHRRRRFSARWWLQILLSGLLLSVGIELVQLTIPSRASDIDDVILNTLGTAIGAVLVWRMLGVTGDSWLVAKYRAPVAFRWRNHHD